MTGPIVPTPTDHKTRVAVQGTYLRQALEALRRAITLEDNDEQRDVLTGATAVVALVQRATAQEYADIRQREAQTVSAALEG